jgi:hypothetical protein
MEIHGKQHQDDAAEGRGAGEGGSRDPARHILGPSADQALWFYRCSIGPQAPGLGCRHTNPTAVWMSEFEFSVLLSIKPKEPPTRAENNL